MKNKDFKKEERKAGENISKLFNPNNQFKRTQKAILESIFGKWEEFLIIFLKFIML